MSGCHTLSSLGLEAEEEEETEEEEVGEYVGFCVRCGFWSVSPPSLSRLPRIPLVMYGSSSLHAFPPPTPHRPPTTSPGYTTKS